MYSDLKIVYPNHALAKFILFLTCCYFEFLSIGKFVVTVLPPVSTKGYSADDVGKLAELVRKQMLGVFNETSMQRLETNGVY